MDIVSGVGVVTEIEFIIVFLILTLVTYGSWPTYNVGMSCGMKLLLLSVNDVRTSDGSSSGFTGIRSLHNY